MIKSNKNLNYIFEKNKINFAWKTSLQGRMWVVFSI